MIGPAFDLLLALIVIAVALAATLGRDNFGAVVFFIVYGSLLAVAWTRLGAVDVALAEAAIGAGLTGLLLVGALARLSRLEVFSPKPPGAGARALCALTAASVAAVVAYALTGLDPDGGGLTETVAADLDRSGVQNPVTAVLLNFRGYDTLLESIVLLVVLVGVWSLAQDRHWGGAPGLAQHARPDGVLATFARALPPIGLLIGVYVVWVGTSEPGGAFQGATILAAVWLLAAMAGLTDAPSVTRRSVRVIVIAGPALFLAIGTVGALAGTFLALPPDHAKRLIQVIEAGLTISIAATLALLVLGFPQRAPP
ncbi:MAG: hydrogenase subunit MbhD domain-containing protein [Pseudomonadota bacterium]